MDSPTVLQPSEQQTLMLPELASDDTRDAKSDIYFWLPIPYQETSPNTCQSIKTIVPYEELYMMRVKQLVGIISQPLHRPFLVNMTAFTSVTSQQEMFRIAGIVMSALLVAGLYETKNQIQSLDLSIEPQHAQPQIAVKLTIV